LGKAKNGYRLGEVAGALGVGKTGLKLRDPPADLPRGKAERWRKHKKKLGKKWV